jgi:hypothetical protein
MIVRGATDAAPEAIAATVLVEALLRLGRKLGRSMRAGPTGPKQTNPCGKSESMILSPPLETLDPRAGPLISREFGGDCGH